MFKLIYELDKYSRSGDLKQKDFDHMFHLMDEQGTGKITKPIFMRIFDIYELWKYEKRNKTSVLNLTSSNRSDGSALSGNSNGKDLNSLKKKC